MPRIRLAKQTIDRLAPGHRDEIYWDTLQTGLHLKVTPAGKKVLFVYYRTRSGQQRRQKVGDYGAITVQQARERSKSILGSVASGNDPAQERSDQRRRHKSGKVADL